VQELVEKILSEIRSRGAIPFHDFMQMALYCPVYGYYEKEGDKIGRRGDFYTSVSVGPLFGQLLAHQFAEWLDCPEIIRPVHRGDKQRSPLNQIVEAGAHDGALAKDILTWIQQHRPTFFERLEYIIIEPSRFRRARQELTLSAFGEKVRWFEDFGSARLSISGVIFSNELLDALPVHRAGWDAKARSWFEWGVTWENNRFAWARLQMDPGPQKFLPEIGDELRNVLPDGFTAEVPLAAIQWWRQASARLKHGRLMAIDYGLEAEEFLRPDRAQGTLRAFRRHQPVADVLSDPGEQDLTTHVNFSALKGPGEACGLATESIQTQAQFLTNIFAKISSPKSGFGPWTEQHTRQFQTLTHPEHLGRAFRVLVQSRPYRSKET
jgi:SAM-dependent MidA family methyltransferase